MVPSKYNITVYRGRDYAIDFTFQDKDGNNLDISSWLFHSQIRDGECPEANLLATFRVTKDTANARVLLTLPDSETLLIPEGKAFWDLLVTIGSIDESFVCGKVKVKCCVTEVIV